MSGLYHSGDIIGKTVVDEQGRHVGVVEDLTLDPHRWHVEGVVVALEDEAAKLLGTKRPLFGHARLDISTPRIASATDVVVVRGSLQELALALRGEELGLGPGPGGP